MDFKRLMRFMPNERKEQLQKVIDTLKIGGRSEKTISNYVHAIYRFLKYFQNKDISSLNEDDIIEYIKYRYLNKSCSGNTYNMNVSAIKYFYIINFNKEFNNKLLPRTKLTKRLPSTLSKDIFIKILNEENKFEYKDYKNGGIIKEMTVTAEEFIRRFLLHILPSRFTKIRHYGILSNRNKKTIIKLCRVLIGTVVNKDFSINITRKLKEFICPCRGSKSFSYSFLYCSDYRLNN